MATPRCSVIDYVVIDVSILLEEQGQRPVGGLQHLRAELGVRVYAQGAEGEGDICAAVGARMDEEEYRDVRGYGEVG